MKKNQRQSILLQIYKEALLSVNGRSGVRYHLSNIAFEKPLNSNPLRIVSIGKAAEAMALGAVDVIGESEYQCLVINKSNYSVATEFNVDRVTVLEAGHPVPDVRSLQAGNALIEFIKQSPAEAQLVFLISGGASSLVEVLADGVTFDDLEKTGQWLLTNGLDINQINAVRKAMSCIKGGRLATQLGNRKTRVLLISDVPENDPAVIGSGLLVADSGSAEILANLKLPDWLEEYIKKSSPTPSITDACFNHIEVEIISDNWRAQQAAFNEAETLGYAVFREQQLICGDVNDAAKKISQMLIGARPGVYIWGGETTVSLPEQTGQGGRNQHLALSIACEIAGDPTITILVAATDGSDGPTEFAGAIVDGETTQDGLNIKIDARDFLSRADAGSYLHRISALFKTGPTGTNVMDLFIALKLSKNDALLS